MDYQITMLTLSKPIPTGGSTSGVAQYEPWYNIRVPLTLTDPSLSVVTLNDSDTRLDNIFAAQTAKAPETEQRLVAPTTFGAGSAQVTLPAGTQLSFAYGSYIQDSDGNRFIATFPNTGTTTVSGTVVGGKYSVLILPLPKTDAAGQPLVGPDGKPVYPLFDPTKTLTQHGRVSFGQSNYGITYSFGGPVDCFAAGTLIDTAFGPRPVETLRAGDMIRTRDNGLRWLAWTGGVHVDAARLDLQPNLRPFRIRAGTLGPGRPARDLVLSPQHRVLMVSPAAERMFGCAEVLVAVKHLAGLPGIAPESPPGGISYHHLLFDGHEIVRAEGAWAESLYLGAQALLGVGPAGRREIAALFPELTAAVSTGGAPPNPARRLLTGREGRKLTETLLRRGRRTARAA